MSGTHPAEAAGPPAGDSTRRGRRRRGSALEQVEGFEGQEQALVSYFKERVYATFTGLAILMVVNGSIHPDAEHALYALLLGVLGITVAGFVSDVISHLAVHRGLPDRAQMLLLVRVAGGALGTVLVPGILLVLAWLEVLPFDGALVAATAVYIGTLAVIGWFAVRRSRLRWWEQLLALGVLVALGLAVVGLQILAHSA